MSKSDFEQKLQETTERAEKTFKEALGATDDNEEVSPEQVFGALKTTLVGLLADKKAGKARE